MFQFIKNIFSRKDNKHCIVKIGREGENIEINVNGKKEIVENKDFVLEDKVELWHLSKDCKKITRKAGEGICKLDRSGLKYIGSEDGVDIEKEFPITDIYRILFGAGEDFEIYDGKELYYFVPKNKRSCVAWYIVSEILKEI